MKFFIVIGKNALYTYKNNGQQFKIQFIEGSDHYSYNLSNISEDINGYLEALSNEKNLGTKAKLEFDVLESSDNFCNVSILRELDGYVNKKYDLNDSIKTVIKKLSKDKALMIPEYGINYDGYSYIMNDGILEKKEFDLLAYTIHSGDMIELMEMN